MQYYVTKSNKEILLVLMPKKLLFTKWWP